MDNQESKIKYPHLLTISSSIGLLGLIVGWLLFLSWSTGRYWAAIDLGVLERIGILWIFCYVWLFLLALIFLIVYIFNNRRHEKLYSKMFFTAVMVLINIPSIVIILLLFSKIKNKAFLKFSNQSNIELIELEIIGNGKSWNVAEIKKGSSEVYNFEPYSLIYSLNSNDDEGYFYLIVKHAGHQDTLELPDIHGGRCEEVIIDKNFEIKEK